MGNETASATIRVYPRDRDRLNALLSKLKKRDRRAAAADVVHDLLESIKTKKPESTDIERAGSSTPHREARNKT